MPQLTDNDRFHAMNAWMSARFDRNTPGRFEDYAITLCAVASKAALEDRGEDRFLLYHHHPGWADHCKIFIPAAETESHLSRLRGKYGQEFQKLEKHLLAAFKTGEGPVPSYFEARLTGYMEDVVEMSKLLVSVGCTTSTLCVRDLMEVEMMGEFRGKKYRFYRWGKRGIEELVDTMIECDGDLSNIPFMN